MINLRGTPVSGGVATGYIKILENDISDVKKHEIISVAKEVERFKKAVEKTKEAMGVLYEKTVELASEDEAEIFGIHIMMLEDGSLTECAESIIFEQNVNAEYALTEAAKILSQTLNETNDEYMMARTADIEDIKNSVISSMKDTEEKQQLQENTIIFAYDLTPSQTINLDKSKIAAFVTEKGSKNSHTAILARSMNIPSIICATGCMNMEFDEKMCAIDADTGEIFISPDENTRDKILTKYDEIEKRQIYLSSLIGKESKTLSGKKINLYANIGNIEDTDEVLKNDGEGIGLFRSEFLYIGKDELPDEKTQFNAYKKVLTAMNGKETIIRTLDIGADKRANCLQLEKEENPALGYRAIRICLDDTEIFKTQLRALYRASVFGKLSIMFPMITSKEEVIQAKAIAEIIKKELKEENIPYDENVKIGIMIETPASAIISDELAPLVDFFSIGTNDLTQYTLACDRQNEKVDYIYKPDHEAVLKLIETTCTNAHAHGIWVGICGELASDITMTEKLIQLGADELSVSPPYILSVRESIINSK